MITPSEKRPSDIALRMGSSVVMIVVAIVALVAGDILFWLLAVVAGLFMLAEWSDLAGVTAKHKRLAQFSLSVPLAIMAPAWLAAGPNFFALGLIAGAAFFTAIATKRAEMAVGTLYVGLPIFSLLLIREQTDGIVLTLWAMALVWACDIGAFFTGRSLGGPKLAPSISPAKTWSGLAGGVVLASLIGLAMHAAYDLPLPLVLVTPLLAVVAQIGDLYESHLKRRAGVKDSGNVLPGHGGVMDRLDGIVPVAPLAALFIVLPKLFA